MVIKLNKYLNAGVKEYWMIDPDKQKLMVYKLEQEEYFPEIYGFDQTVAITVMEEPCKIDLKDMYDYITFLYQG